MSHITSINLIACQINHPDNRFSTLFKSPLLLGNIYSEVYFATFITTSNQQKTLLAVNVRYNLNNRFKKSAKAKQRNLNGRLGED